MTERDSLDAFFDTARAEAPVPDGDLIARIMADAEAEADRRETARQAPARGGWQRVFNGFGGWPALAGLMTAAVTGVWIGFVMPDIALSGAAEATTFELGDLTLGYSDFAMLDGS